MLGCLVFLVTFGVFQDQLLQELLAQTSKGSPESSRLHAQVTDVWAAKIAEVLGTRPALPPVANATALFANFGLVHAALPRTIRRVVIDVGWQFRSEFENRGQYGPAPDRLLIGFEANCMTWGAAHAVKTGGGKLQCNPKEGCIVVLPLAVAQGGRTVSFNTGDSNPDTTGCDSVLSVNRLPLRWWSPGDWPCFVQNGLCALVGTLHDQAFERCQRIAPNKVWSRPILGGDFIISLNSALVCMSAHKSDVTRQSTMAVPSVELADVLEWLPDWLPQVQLVKVDAQGADLLVVQTIGLQQAHRVAKVQVELQDLPANDPLRMYSGSNTRDEFKQHLGHLGFKETYCKFQNCAMAEANCFYERAHDS